MPPYCYFPLSSELGSIRLLRIIPHQDETADIQCELFEYSLQSSRSTHLYEALSYVWGDPDETLPILVHGKTFNVTVNLHAALLQLRNHSIERLIWIDAICIDQGNQAEKENQIQYMANIYGQANRVLVWLGEAANNSDLAFEEMRRVRDKEDITTLRMQRLELAALALLQRSWFQRIWILQEVAAARNILIMCGNKKIDGHIFCSGIESLNISYRTRQDLQRLIRSVTYLIREAPYRPDYSKDITDGSTGLDICPLGGLLDMYHAQKATKRHDKVYALLSMSSDNLRGAGLSPDYSISWGKLFQRLLKHLIAGSISVQTCEHREVAIIKSKGRILGKVVSVQKDPIRGDRLRVEVALQGTLMQPRETEDWSNHWNIQISAKPIQKGDFICVLEGALKPAIIRLHKDYFTIVVLEVLFSDESLRRNRSFERKASLLSKTHSSGDLLLVWNWESSLGDKEDPQDYETWIGTNNWKPDQIKPGPEGYLAKARRVWNVVLVLEDIVPGWADSTEYEEMEERVREVIEGCEKALGAADLLAPESKGDRTPPSWTTQDSYGAVVDLLFTGTHMTTCWYYGVSKVGLLLFWAAQGDHRAVVELLLTTGNIDMNILTISTFRKWPLYVAVYEGHKHVVELLLKLGKLNMHTMNLAASVLLPLAAERGHEDVLGILLGAWPEVFDSEHYLGPQPLWVAASKGYENTVRQLLETVNIDVDKKGVHGQTPLLRAAAVGHAAVVKLLLSTEKVDPSLKDDNERTSLWLAASEGHTAVVKLLLETGKVEVNSKNQYGETPLSRAVLGGHEAVVKLLLETRQVDFEAKDSFSLQTPLSLAVERGYEAIVQLLLKEGQFDISLEDGFSSLSPLSRAANGGRTAIVKLLLEAEIVAIEGRTLPPQPPPSLPVSGHPSRAPRRRGLAKLLNRFTV